MGPILHPMPSEQHRPRGEPACSFIAHGDTRGDGGGGEGAREGVDSVWGGLARSLVPLAQPLRQHPA